MTAADDCVQEFIVDDRRYVIELLSLNLWIERGLVSDSLIVGELNDRSHERNVRSQSQLHVSSGSREQELVSECSEKKLLDRFALILFRNLRNYQTTAFVVLQELIDSLGKVVNVDISWIHGSVLLNFDALVSALDAVVRYSVEARLIVEHASCFVMEVILVLSCYDFVSSSVAVLFRSEPWDRARPDCDAGVIGRKHEYDECPHSLLLDEVCGTQTI